MTRLYLVDDHQIMREGLRALLEARGHHVVGESADPTEALADLLRLRPEVLLLDLNLGGRSGLELLTELQRRRLPTRCIVLTMSGQPRQVAEALRMGASAYVLKGSAGSDLMSAIDAAVQGKKYLGADVADLAMQVYTQQDKEDPLSTLSPRERQIIIMVVNGQSSAEIGLKLHLSPKTVATYRSRLMAKLGVSDVPGLVRLAIRHKLIDSEDR
ncbi:response regulator [Rhodoferax sp. UBA5149]|uniref:response regulator n=1 Tax=Rhodoferax sp. UBA5149 TaxID=1947379 RepID=UPI0025DC96AA|nr:response regulator transcription factor [Rhodoferax sp. UBA5149]